MKVVKSVLTLAAMAAMMSAGTAWAQCCCGAATYTGMAASGAVMDGEAGSGAADASAGNGNCSYTVMQTRRRVVMEQQQVTRYRTQVSFVNETRQVPVTRYVRETNYRTKTYTVRRPVRTTTYKTVN